MKALALGAVFGAALIAQTAGAATFEVSQQNSNIFNGPNYSQNVNVNYNGSNQTLGAGIFRLVAKQLINGVEQDAQNFDAFCIDLDNNIDLPKVYMTAPNYFDAQTASRVDALFTNVPIGGITSSREAAATQLALWEIVTDETLDLGDGDFKLRNNNPAGTVSDATDYLKKITDGDWTGGGADFLLLDTEGSQDVIAFGVQPIPLPASVWLLAAGVAGLGALRRKRA